MKNQRLNLAVGNIEVVLPGVHLTVNHELLERRIVGKKGSRRSLRGNQHAILHYIGALLDIVHEVHDLHDRVRRGMRGGEGCEKRSKQEAGQAGDTCGRFHKVWRWFLGRGWDDSVMHKNNYIVPLSG